MVLSSSALEVCASGGRAYSLLGATRASLAMLALCAVLCDVSTTSAEYFLPILGGQRPYAPKIIFRPAMVHTLPIPGSSAPRLRALVPLLGRKTLCTRPRKLTSATPMIVNNSDEYLSAADCDQFCHRTCTTGMSGDSTGGCPRFNVKTTGRISYKTTRFQHAFGPRRGAVRTWAPISVGAEFGTE